MDDTFRKVIESLHPTYQTLLSSTPTTGLAPSGSGSGIYLFSEAGKHLYVGRTRNARKRYDLHCKPHSDHNGASFAFKLAREATGIRPTYRKGEGRATLLLKPNFLAAFQNAKARIRAMEFRFVSEPDPTKQALLEAYVSIALGTPYNDFDTH